MTTTNYLLRLTGTEKVVTENEKIMVFANIESADLHKMFGDLPEGVKPEMLEIESVEVEG